MKFASLLRQCLSIAIAASAVAAFVWAAPAFAERHNLPDRSGPTPRTTNGVPHVQIGVEPVPEISAELLRRVSEIPGVEIGATVISLPGAKGFWVRKNVDLARPDVIVGGREFAHMHPDGSLHASLPPELATTAVRSGWAIHHPWANERPGWEGFVMIYTPGSSDELEVVLQLVLASYQFVTGTSYTGGRQDWSLCAHFRIPTDLMTM